MGQTYDGAGGCICVRDVPCIEVANEEEFVRTYVVCDDSGCVHVSLATSASAHPEKNSPGLLPSGLMYCAIIKLNNVQQDEQ